MRRKRIAICDCEQEYARRFMEYANQRADPGFTVHAFTNCGELAAFAEENPVDMLLLSRTLIQELRGKERLGLMILLSEEPYLAEEPEYPVIYKFQSCEQILRQVMDYYAEQAPAGHGLILRASRMRRIGVYSPVGRIGKTSFALALGKELAKKKKTLYLNLEEYSGFEMLYPYADGWTLAELMYFLKQGKNAFACKLEVIVRKMGGLDYIPPLKSPVELRHISLEDWQRLLEALERESSYEVLILDLGGAVDGLFELLEYCDGIYTPAVWDEMGKAKLSQYEETLKLLGMEETLEKSRQFWLPEGGEELENLVRTEADLWLGV